MRVVKVRAVRSKKQQLKPSAQKALAYMINNGSITVGEMLAEFGTTELRSRISEIRRAGYPVRKVMETGINRNGEPVCYARYFLENGYDKTVLS